MPAPVLINRRESGLDQAKSPMLHSALSTSLSRSFGLNSPFSLSALSSSLTHLSSSPGFSSMGMSLGRSFEERPKLEAQFFRNFTCCGLDLQDLHGLLEHFEECHVAFDDDPAHAPSAAAVAAAQAAGGAAPNRHQAAQPSAELGGMDMDDAASEGTISGPPSPRMTAHHGSSGGGSGGSGGAPLSRVFEAKKSALSAFEMPDSPATGSIQLDPAMELDMEMEEDEEGSSPGAGGYAPVASTSANTGGINVASNGTPGTIAFQPKTLSAFENSLPLHQKKFNSAMSAHHQMMGRTLGTMGPIGGAGGGGGGLEALQAAGGRGGGASAYSTPDSSIPGTPVMEEIPGQGVDGIFSLPPSAVQVSGPGVGNGSTAPVGLAPSLLFPNNPADSPPEDDHDGSASSQHGGNDSSASGSMPRESRHLGSGSNGPQLHDYPNDSKEAQTVLLAAALGQNSVAALPTALHPLGTGVQISPSGRPYTPPSEKPFKCSVPGCDKSYKQQNGLKYHRLHGHCNASQGKEGSDSKGEGKPYVCHVASCGKRYKNMNGLRYHYQHSGAHGALGLQMLSQGCHPPPQFPPGHKRAGQQHHGSANHHSHAQHHSGGSSSRHHHHTSSSGGAAVSAYGAYGNASAQAAGHSAPNSRSASPAPGAFASQHHQQRFGAGSRGASPHGMGMGGM